MSVLVLASEDSGLDSMGLLRTSHCPILGMGEMELRSQPILD